MNDVIRTLLMQALASQQKGDMAGAEGVCKKVLDIDPNQADALQFLGLIEETKGNLEKAKELMERSLSVNPNQPHVLNNLANLLHENGKSDEGETLLKKALSMQPNYWEAWYNLGKLYFDLKKYQDAKEPLLKASENWQTPIPRAQTLLGNLYQHTGEYEKSNHFYEAALKIKPDYFNAMHHYGMALKRQQKIEEALSVYQKAKQVKPQSPDLFYNIGVAQFDLDNIEEAVTNLQRAVTLNPDFLEAHFALNEVLWRSGQKDLYCTSYKKAIERGSVSIPLRVQFLEDLIKVQRFEEIEKELEKAFLLDPDNAKLWHLKAKMLVVKGEIDQTISTHKKCIALDPKNILFRKDLAKIFIKISQPELALKEIEKAHALQPEDQEILAYLGLCWRLTGNEKAAWLNDFDAFIRAYKIPVPPGYKNLEEFNLALNKALDRFHTAKDQPSDQTLRGGTQSIAELLEKNVKEIQEARKSFEETIRRYISDLPDDPSHPLLSRKSEAFTFAGSWSVRLRKEGFHVNHTHPEGWLSSCYYVALPETIKKGGTKDGWIKFGESPLSLGEKELIGKEVQPEEGLLVLFPSYMFHGTYPFHSDEFRTTLPFDVIPL